MRKQAVILCLILFTAGMSEALSIKEYLERSKSEDKIQRAAVNAYVLGMGEGLYWANIGIKDKHNLSLFCLPKNLPLEPKQYITILDQSIEKYKNTESIKAAQNDSVLGLLLLTGLEATYPCNKK